MILSRNVKTNEKGEELRQHGTHLFPVAFYLVMLPNDEISWHWHNELEFCIVTEGAAMLEAAGRKYLLRAGEGAFINSNILHSVAVENGSCVFHSVVFHPLAVSGSTDNVIWQKYLKPLMENQACPSLRLTPDTDWQKRIVDGFSSIWQEDEAQEYGYEMQIRNGLSEMITLIAGHQPAAGKKAFGKEQRDGVRIREMLTFIQKNFCDEITIEDIAAVCAISVSECIRCFRATIGKTPIAFLKAFRLKQAALKLQFTDENITSIAESCGFSDMSYFSKAFRETYKCTPSEYRER